VELFELVAFESERLLGAEQPTIPDEVGTKLQQSDSTKQGADHRRDG
jgi:hypothetical protein